MCIAGLWFGGFQALMPAIGYYLGSFFTVFINTCSYWVAFILLLIIGGNMIKEALGKEEEEVDASMTVKTMFVLAIATSIDALAVGISFAFVGMNSWQAIGMPILVIGAVSFAFSVIGCLIGVYLGKRINLRAELWAGIILIGIGAKILLEHLELL